MAGHGQVRADRDAPAAVELGARLRRRAPSRAPRRRRPRPRRPCARGSARLAAAAGETVTQSVVDVDDRWPTAGSTPSRSSARAARSESDGGNVGRTRSAVSTRRMRAERVSAARKSRRSVSRAISAIWPASSTPVGPAPTTTNVSQAARRLGVVLDLGRLERSEDPAPHVERALERLDVRRDGSPFVVAEVGVAGPGGDDQRVVRELALGVAVRQPLQEDAARRRGRTADLAEDHADVAVALEHRSAAAPRSRPATSAPVATW